MSLVRLLLNVLWILTGGIWMAAAWVIAGVLLAITVIGIPFAWAHLKLAVLALSPIGKMVIPMNVVPVQSGYSGWR